MLDLLPKKENTSKYVTQTELSTIVKKIASMLNSKPKNAEGSISSKLIKKIIEDSTPSDDELRSIIKTLIPPPLQGEPGLDGNHGNLLSAEEIIEKLKSIKGDGRLLIDIIKGGKRLLSRILELQDATAKLNNNFGYLNENVGELFIFKEKLERMEIVLNAANSASIDTFVASGVVVGNDLTLTLNDLSTVVINVSSLISNDVQSVTGSGVDNTDPLNPILFSVQSLVAGTNIIIDDTDPENIIVSAVGGAVGGQVDSVVAGAGIAVDNTDPVNPIVSCTISGGVQTVTGGSVDNTDPLNPIVNAVEGVTGSGVDNTDPFNPILFSVQSLVGGTGATVDNTDPENPIINVTVVNTDQSVKATAADTTSGFLDSKLNISSSDGTVIVIKTITNPGGNEVVDYDLKTVGGGSGGATNIQIDSTPDSGTYGLLAGAVDGVNSTFTVSLLAYNAGKLLVSLNGLVQNQGALNDYVEIDPTLGTFQFNTPPATNDIIVVEYQTVATITQVGVQFEDEGSLLGTAGTVNELDFTGSGVTATRVGAKVTVNVPGGSGTTKKVGVGDISDIQWFNIQYPFFDVGMWDLSNVLSGVKSPSSFEIGTGDWILASSGFNHLLPDFNVSSGQLRFNTSQQVIFQITIKTNTSSLINSGGGIGFCTYNNASWGRPTFASLHGVGFVRGKDGQWYTKTANGSSMTENLIIIADNTIAVLRCEYEPAHATPQARFYVNGVLVDTITTTLPTATVDVIGFYAGQEDIVALSKAVDFITCPTFSVEI